MEFFEVNRSKESLTVVHRTNETRDIYNRYAGQFCLCQHHGTLAYDLFFDVDQTGERGVLSYERNELFLLI